MDEWVLKIADGNEEIRYQMPRDIEIKPLNYLKVSIVVVRPRLFGKHGRELVHIIKWWENKHPFLGFVSQNKSGDKHVIS